MLMEARCCDAQNRGEACSTITLCQASKLQHSSKCHLHLICRSYVPEPQPDAWILKQYQTPQIPHTPPPYTVFIQTKFNFKFDTVRN